MNHDVAPVNQHPVTLTVTFNRNTFQAQSLHFLPEMVGHRANLTLRRSVGDYHIIGNLRFPSKFDNDNILGLVVIQARFHQLKQFSRSREPSLSFCYGQLLILGFNKRLPQFLTPVSRYETPGYGSMTQHARALLRTPKLAVSSSPGI